MRINPLIALSIMLLAVPIGAQPREWSDDFTTQATYDSASTNAPCYGGTLPKYTLISALDGNIFRQHAVSGSGRLNYTRRHPDMIYNMAIIDLAGVGWVNFSGCPGPDTSEPFTSANVCVYGGVRFNPWQLRSSRIDTWGADGQPGRAGIDDDLDGTTDETNESPLLRPTTVNNGWGNLNGTGFQAGQDGAPGVAGVDDDANGIIDDSGETCWSGSDDGDDMSHFIYWTFMRANFNTTSTIYVNMDLAWDDSQFALYQINSSTYSEIEGTNEITYGYYQPYRQYNYVFCASGTVFGAALWSGTDMANPAETLGPMINSTHTGSASNVTGFGYVNWNDPGVGQYLRQMTFYGNTNFSDKYWVVSGLPSLHYPSPSPDLDQDKDVDGFDFLTFSNCYNGSNKPPLAACANPRADLDKDGDVDGFDFLTFSNCYNGSNRRPLNACFPSNVTAAIPPGNDTCAGAIPIGEGDTLGTITGATTRSYNHSCSGGIDVWFKYTPTCTGTATISTCDVTGVSNPVLNQLALALYSTCPPSPGSQIACVDSQSCGNDRETVNVSVTSGVPIYIAVIGNNAGWGNQIGNFKLAISCGS